MIMKAIFSVVVLAVAVTAFDFTSLAPGQTERLSDGHIRVRHNLDKKFLNENGKESFIHLDATAEYHESWNFVDLHEFSAAGGVGVSKFCHEASVTNQVISVLAKDTASLTAMSAAVSMPKAIIKVSGLRCGGQAVFAHLESIVSTTGLTMKLSIRTALLEEIFRHAKVRMNTNHIQTKSFTPEEADAVLRADLVKEGLTQPVSRRSMNEQHWWHHFKHTIEHAYHHVTHIAKDIGHDVEHLAHDVENVYNEAKGLMEKAEEGLKYIVNLAEGNFDTNKDWTIAKAHWGPESLKYSPLIAAPANGMKHEVYAGFDLQVIFEIDIHYYSLRSFKAALIGDAEAVASLSVGETHSGSYRKQICDIRFGSINFMIGPVPVHIMPYMPIVMGLEYSTHASAQFAVVATGHIEYGFQYNHGHFSPIADHKFTFTKHHNFPKPELSVTVSITPSAVMNIDFLGGPIASLDLLASANLVDTVSPAYIQFNAHSSVVLSAVFKLRIAGHTILGPKTLGPYTYDATSYNLGKVDIPKIHLTRAMSELAQQQVVSTGVTFRGQGVASSDCPFNQDVTFQVLGSNAGVIGLAAVISTSANEPTTGQHAIANIIAPYNLAAGIDAGSYNLYPANSSDVSSSTSAPWLSTNLPSFTANLAGNATHPTMTLSQQIGGIPMCANGDVSSPMVMSSGVYTSTAAPHTTASTKSDSKNHFTIIAAASAAGVFAVVSVVAIIAVVRRRGATATVEMSVMNVPMTEATEDVAQAI